MNKLELYLKRILIFLSVIYLSVRIFLNFFVLPIGGDEYVFVNDLIFIKENGLYVAIEKGISIPYMLLTIPFSYIFSELTALRIFGLICFILLLLYAWWRYKNTFIMIFIAIFASYNGFFFFGYNDSLFILCLVVFFSELYLLFNNLNSSIVLSLVGLIMAILTRSYFIVYLPAMLLAISGLFYFKNISYKKLGFPVVLLIILFTLNIPSILNKGKISYDYKPPKSEKVNWEQYQYLSQLEINKGNLPENHWVSWQQVEDYVEENGENSLPKSSIEAIFFDLKLTVKEFFKDLIFVTLKSVREIVLLHFIALILFIVNLRKNVNILKIYKNYIPIIAWLTFSIFSFIIINNVETRWLSVIYILIIFYCFTEYNKVKDFLGIKMDYIMIFNNILTILIILYGMYSKTMFQLL